MKPSLIFSGLLATFVLWLLPLFFATFFFTMTTQPFSMLGVVTLVCIVGGVLLGTQAASAAKVWRYALLIGAAFVFIAPVASCMGVAATVSSHTKDSVAAGAAIVGAGISSIFLGFFTTIIAVIYLVAGLLIGRDPKTIIVQHMNNAPTTPAAPNNASSPRDLP